MNILWLKPDGSIAFTMLCPEAFPDSDPQEAALAHAKELLANGGVPPDWKAVAHDHKDPPHHWPQDVWAWDGTKVVFHVDRGREMRKQELRRERAPLLAELDVAYMRAQEAGKPTADIVASKARLRDVTKLVDAAKTPEEIAAVKL
jgi:hypothetical protein